MRGARDPKVLWLIGAVLMIFCAVGLVASATLIALPLFGIAYALGASTDAQLKVVLISAILWAPLGFGAGVATSAGLIKGMRAKGAPEEGS
jgi:hypothetical protein